MKNSILVFALIFTFTAIGSAQTRVGKIVQLINNVDITSLTSGKKTVPSIGDEISTDHKIRTGKKSFVEILLDDGTKLSMKEVSVLNISSLKLKDSDKATRVRLLTGKVRIALKRVFRGEHSLILKTPTAIAGVRGTDFGAIATSLETKILVFDGKVEVANANKNIIKSVLLRPREESGITKNEAPTEPRTVPQEIMKNWFEYYDINDENRIIIKSREEKGFIDRLLRRKDF